MVAATPALNSGAQAALMILLTAQMQARTGEDCTYLQDPQIVGILQDLVMQSENERSVNELLSNPALGPLFGGGGASPAVSAASTTTTTTTTRWGPSAVAKESDAAAAEQRPTLLGKPPGGVGGPQAQALLGTPTSAPMTVNTATAASSLPTTSVPPSKDSSPTPPIVANNLNNLLNTQNLNQLLGSLTSPQQLSGAVTGPTTTASGSSSTTSSLAAARSPLPQHITAISVSSSSSVPGSSVITTAHPRPDPQPHVFNAAAPCGNGNLLSMRRAGQRPVLLSDPPALPSPPPQQQQQLQQQRPQQGAPFFARPTAMHQPQVGQGLNTPAAIMMSSTTTAACPPPPSTVAGSFGAQQQAMAAMAAAATAANPYHQQQQQSPLPTAVNPFIQQLQQTIPGLGITGPPPSHAFLFGAASHDPLLSAQMMAPQAVAAAAAVATPAGVALQQHHYASYLIGCNGGADGGATVNPYLAPMSPQPVANPQLAVGAQLAAAAALSTPPMAAGMKRKLTIPPSPEQSPDGPYIGQHSQGLGGHYADSYWRKKAKYN